MSLRWTVALLSASACSTSPPAPPTADECQASCQRFTTECDAGLDCDDLCRDVVVEGEDGTIACLESRGTSFVDCADTAACDPGCAVEAADLATCNRIFCGLRPDSPACTTEP